jgi:hypothetical protein
MISLGGIARNDLYERVSCPRNATLCVFFDIELIEHTWHGALTIINKYCKEVFEITDSCEKYKVQFDVKVLELIQIISV